MFKRNIVFALLLVLLFFGSCGCVSVEINNVEENVNHYSREYINEYSKSADFYTSRDNSLDVALEYLYNDEEVKDVCGDKFEVDLEDVVIVKDDTEIKKHFFHYSFSGEAEYIISIDKVSYRMILEKEWEGKWEVIDCFLTKNN